MKAQNIAENTETANPGIDPVLALARTASGAFDLSNQLDEEMAAARKAGAGFSVALETRAEHVNERWRHALDGISHVRATSIEGAAVQLLAAMVHLDLIGASEPDATQTSRDARQVQRLVLSALAAVEAKTGVRARDLLRIDMSDPQEMAAEILGEPNQ